MSPMRSICPAILFAFFLLASAAEVCAEEEKHWAYVAPEAPDLPEVSNPKWPQNGIDYFVMARLDAEGLSPAPEADPYTLIRRLTLDITGLPPTIEGADAFVNDNRADRMDWAIDRLLASPAYGEHMARAWLDLARYADSNGYHIDTKRSMWPYRDWIINAFNENMPFDQFTIEQIAGDLLPDSTQSQRIATGFHRNTMFNEEGGIDPEEFRTKAVVDRVNTTMTVWMGTTMSCAECHEHKYDPFSQEEFYQLYAFFNNVPELGGGTFQSLAPLETLPLSESDQAELAAIESVIADLEKQRDAINQRLTESLDEWIARARGKLEAWQSIAATSATSTGGSTLTILEDKSIRASGELNDPHIDTYTVSGILSPGRYESLALELIPDESLPQSGPGRAPDGQFVLTDVAVSIGDDTKIAFANARATYQLPKRKAAQAIDDNPAHDSGWSAGKRPGQGDTLILTLAEPLTAGADSPIQIVLTQRLSHHTIGRFRLWAGVAVDDDAPPPHLFAAIQTDSNNRNPDQTQFIIDYRRSRLTAGIDARIATQQERAAEVRKRAPTTLVMAEQSERRITRIHKRGNFLDPGEEVTATTPVVLHALDTWEKSAPDRLDLAYWLVDERNPLTARVIMNRLWAQIFGRGIVDTLEDFGTRGARPTHPELLDYLATQFIASGWDLKAMVRMIVSSATYAQSSAVGSEAYATDPDNRLIARGPRFRMEAEAVRDIALAASGLLMTEIGGPPVHPYQPAGLYEEKIQTGYDVGAWPVVYGDELYRRSLYTFRRRSVPFPMFQTFDAPSFEFCAAGRPRTNTPLQALNTLNAPQFVEAARVLAESAMVATQDSGERLRLMFRRCLTRPPSEKEMTQLRSLLDRHLKRFKEDAQSAEAFVTNGRAHVNESLHKQEWAAYMFIAHVLLNVDEAITKN